MAKSPYKKFLYWDINGAVIKQRTLKKTKKKKKRNKPKDLTCKLSEEYGLYSLKLNLLSL